MRIADAAGALVKPLVRIAAVAWLLGWAVFGLPLDGFRARPRVSNVQVLPSPESGRRDAVRNFAYYVPLGLIGMALGWRVGAIAGTAVVLSGGTEVAQLFAESERYPSATDVVLNVGGALAGIAMAEAVRRMRRASRAVEEY